MTVSFQSRLAAPAKPSIQREQPIKKMAMFSGVVPGFVGKRISNELHKPIPGYHKKASPAVQELAQDSFNNPWNPDDLFKTELVGDILNVRVNLQRNLDGLSNDELLQLALLALPLTSYPKNKLAKLQNTQQLPTDRAELSTIKSAILDRQFKALQDITKHALNAERLSVRPLSLGIFKMPRRPDIQLANGTFTTDESRHSYTFERYLTELLGDQQKDITRWDWLQAKAFDVTAITRPSVALFLALMIETVGGSFFEFFSEKAPDPMFRNMCDVIANKDEKRHMKICSTVFNDLYSPKISEKALDRYNQAALKWLPKILYGEHMQPGHPLIQACQAFGVPPIELFNYLTRRIREEFAHIGFDLDFSNYKLPAEITGLPVEEDPQSSKITSSPDAAPSLTQRLVRLLPQPPEPLGPMTAIA